MCVKAEEEAEGGSGADGVRGGFLNARSWLQSSDGEYLGVQPLCQTYDVRPETMADF